MLFHAGMGRAELALHGTADSSRQKEGARNDKLFKEFHKEIPFPLFISEAIKMAPFLGPDFKRRRW
jgi:hypothetical protein